MEIHDVIIVGAGPAGIASAIQLKRYGLNPIVIEKNEPGGILKNANHIENYPGFPGGISGSKLVSLLKRQIDHFNIKIYNEEVIGVDYNDFIFKVRTNYQVFDSVILVIATGTMPNQIIKPVIPYGFDNLIMDEIYQIIDKRDKKIVIIGAGDAAFDYALNLGKHNSVYILNRSRNLKCLPLLKKEIEDNPNIKYKTNSTVDEVIPQNDLLILHCNIEGESKKIIANFLVIAIGREPNIDILSDGIKSKMNDLINSKRLFLIGDVKNKNHRQLSISVGDGVKAAMEIFDELNPG